MFLSAPALGQTSSEEFHSTDSSGCCPTQDCQNQRLRDLMQQRIDYARQCVAARATPCRVEPALVRPPLCSAPKEPALDGGKPGGDVFGSDSSRPGGGKPTAPPAGARPPLLTGTAVINDCVPTPDRRAQAELRKTGIEALDTLAAMGQQADGALNDMGQAIVEELAYLAQPNATVWRKRNQKMRAAAQVAIDYLANDNAANHDKLRRAAEDATAAAQRHPTGVVGRIAAGILTGKVTSLSGAICKSTAGKLQKAVVDRIKAQKAAKQLKAVMQAEKEFKEIFGETCGDDPIGNRSTPLPPNPLNPEGRGYSCVTATWADELNDEMGAPVFNESHFRWEPEDAGTPWDRIWRVQEEQWGDRRFVGHDPVRAHFQAEGKPVIMRNGDGMQDIIDELLAAGDGASGIVTIRRLDGSVHSFRAKNFGGEVKFRDPATNSPGGFNFDPAFNSGPIQHSAFYRTTGPDMLPGPPLPRRRASASP